MDERRSRSIRRLGRTAAVVVSAVASVALVTAAFAAAPLTKVSHDPFTNTSSYHQTQVEPDTFSYGSTIVSVFQTGRFSDGGSDDTGWATSTNGGQTWHHGFLPGTTPYSTPAGPYQRISDPSIAYDPKHDVWLAQSLTVDTKNTTIVSRSTDGGLSWGNPVIVSTPGASSDYDKDWIACDTWAASPNYGNCYSEWDDYFNGDTIMMSTSKDGGKTWSLATVAPAHGLGGQPVAEPNGRVVVPFLSDAGQIQSLVSADGGSTYTGPFTISSQSDHGVIGVRTEPLPSAEVDASGMVYVVWQDCRFRSGCSSNDIVMSTSKKGKTWSSVVRIPIDPVGGTVDHFIPGIAVDPGTSGSSAVLGLTYYYYPKTACSFTTCKMNAAFVSSLDGGATWSTPTRILGPLKLAWLPNAGGRFVGDYISTSFVGGLAFPVIANATTGTCTLGQITSCHEFMVAPTDGLSPLAGTVPVRRESPVPGAHSDHALVRHPTAF